MPWRQVIRGFSRATDNGACAGSFGEFASAQKSNVIGDLVKFIDISRDQDHHGAVRRSLPQLVVDESGCPHVEPTSWVDRDYQVRLGVERSGHDDLLLVAAAQA